MAYTIGPLYDDPWAKALPLGSAVALALHPSSKPKTISGVTCNLYWCRWPYANDCFQHYADPGDFAAWDGFSWPGLNADFLDGHDAADFALLDSMLTADAANAAATTALASRVPLSQTVADITNPALELHALTPSRPGQVVECLQNAGFSAAGRFNRYVAILKGTGTEQSPYRILDASGAYLWIAIGPLYVGSTGIYLYSLSCQSTLTALTIQNRGDLSVQNKAANAYLPWATRDTSNAQVQILLSLIRSLALQSPDLAKTVVLEALNSGALHVPAPAQIDGPLSLKSPDTTKTAVLTVDNGGNATLDKSLYLGGSFFMADGSVPFSGDFTVYGTNVDHSGYVAYTFHVEDARIRGVTIV